MSGGNVVAEICEQTQWVPLDSKRKKLKRLRPRDKIDRLIDWYEIHKPAMSKSMPVYMDAERLEKFAHKLGDKLWTYRGWNLIETEPPVVKPEKIAK